MYIVLPITNDGCSELTVPTPAGLLTFTAYWAPLRSCWLCNIQDGNGGDVATGIALLSGCQNLLKGLGNTVLDGYQLTVLTNHSDNAERNNETWGKQAILVLTPAPGIMPFPLVDPLMQPLEGDYQNVSDWLTGLDGVARAVLAKKAALTAAAGGA